VTVSDRADDKDDEKKDANVMIAGGVGIGAIGLIGAAIGGAVCPVCVVAAPALVGAGVFRRWRVARRGAPPRPER
jgi:hypothetical protein